MGTCFPSLSVIRTALTISLESKDFSAYLDRNLFKLANFPFNFCTSFKHLRDGRLRATSTLSGHTLSPSVSTLYPRKVPSLIPKAHFFGFNFMFISLRIDWKIDWKIESLMEFQYKYFLDAYKGHHQRQMTKKDEEKTAFHTEEGVFCYTKMPFGLKNAGAKYQRLVDSAFKEQIGVNLEAYVDDMVIKSKTEQDIIKDIEQTFSTLRRINMKLNPDKNCFIRYGGRKVLSAERSLPFLDTLKKCTNKKDFRWTKTAEAAFLEMKKLVSELPTFTTPKKGETLMMYLAAASKAVSAVLLIERNRRQMPIHYVSRSLQGVETNYAPMEKLTLALVHAARRLRRYFQAHPIKVITDSPIGQVLNNSGASRRLAKWAVELGAYDITYVPRVAIKGQVLADFLADTSTEISATAEVPNNPRVEDIPEPSNARGDLTPGPKAWRLYTDGASNNEGSGAGLILIAPDDVEYSYALRLNFSNSNNDAEYEALLAGQRIANEM
ncbi:reverse transcriptase domain-containing protein [Tanacetum coccineum]